MLLRVIMAGCYVVDQLAGFTQMLHEKLTNSSVNPTDFAPRC